MKTTKPLPLAAFCLALSLSAMAANQTIMLNPGDTLTVVVPGSTPPTWDLSLPIPSVAAYLVQQVAANGSFPTVYNAADRYLTVSDTLTWRRHDYGDYFASDGVLHTRGWVTTWQAAPFTRFNPGSDGGEFYAYNNGTVIALATQDGGTAGIQRFVGAGCGGDGWIIFDEWAPTGSWKGQYTRLSESSDPNACPPLGNAYTRWRREVVPIYFSISGVPTTITLPCIFYEHYTGANIASATGAEQAGWCLGKGRVWWAAYGPGPAAVDLSARVPALPWPGPPEHASDWVLLDARLYTKVTPVGPGESTTVLWPPAGFTP